MVARYRHFLVFCLIGCGNTAVNFAVAVLCIEFFGSSQTVGNLLAFVAANILSYVANSRWNFRTPLSASGYLRFLLSSGSVVALVLAASAVADYLHIHYLYTLVFLTVVSPVISFLMVRQFAFRK